MLVVLVHGGLWQRLADARPAGSTFFSSSLKSALTPAVPRWYSPPTNSSLVHRHLPDDDHESGTTGIIRQPAIVRDTSFSVDRWELVGSCGEHTKEGDRLRCDDE